MSESRQVMSSQPYQFCSLEVFSCFDKRLKKDIIAHPVIVLNTRVISGKLLN